MNENGSRSTREPDDLPAPKDPSLTATSREPEQGAPHPVNGHDEVTRNYRVNTRQEPPAEGPPTEVPRAEPPEAPVTGTGRRPKYPKPRKKRKRPRRELKRKTPLKRRTLAERKRRLEERAKRRRGRR